VLRDWGLVQPRGSLLLITGDDIANTPFIHQWIERCDGVSPRGQGIAFLPLGEKLGKSYPTFGTVTLQNDA
jgi:hypothetical protein